MQSQAEFIQKIKAHQGLINKVSFLYTNNPEDRKDLRQEILGQAWRAYPKFRQEAKFSTWLYRIAVNVALSSLRKKKMEFEPEIPEDIKIKENGQNGSELLTIILKLLNPIEKSIVLLMVEGYKQPEIAAMLGISEGNTRIKIHRLRNKLKKYGLKEFA